MGRRAGALVGAPLPFEIDLQSAAQDVDLVLPDGTGIVADVRTADVFWDDAPARLVTLRDLTNRIEEERKWRLAAQAAELANQMKSQFLANMSHELRTPLNSIIGFSEMLTGGVVGELNARHRDYVDNILTSGRHLLRLINELLDLSMAEADRIELTNAPFSLTALCDRAASQVTPQLAGKGLTLSRTSEAADLALLGDETRLLQVLLNLLSNAIKFTPAGGEIGLHMKLSGKQAILVVTDTGIGIPQGQMNELFRPFARLDKAYVASVVEGVGLGLALCKRLVELHGGTIRLASTVGEGTSAIVTLPSSRVLSIVDRPRQAAAS